MISNPEDSSDLYEILLSKEGKTSTNYTASEPDESEWK
jgi:hypothetical protein